MLDSIKHRKPLALNSLKESLSKILGDSYLVHASQWWWGGSLFVMEKEAKAACRTYYFFDDFETIGFECLSVSEEFRKNGIAGELLRGHMDLAKEYGRNSVLAAKATAWVHKWYERNGYVDYQKKNDDSGEVWMVNRFVGGKDENK